MKFVFKKNVLRVALIAASFVFSILSLALIALGVVYRDDLTPIKLYVTDVSFSYLPALLIVLGCLSFVSALCGCYFAKNHNQLLLKMLVVFLTLLLAVELAVSSIAFMNLDERLENTTIETMNEQLINNSSYDFSELEESFRCCAVSGLEDYRIGLYTFSNITECGALVEFFEIEADGCAKTITSIIIRISTEIGGVVAVYAFIQICHIVCLLMILCGD